MDARVLLVDDEVDFIDVLAERMEARGLQVDKANDGQSALKIASQKYFDAIILDMAMPGMDGIETLKRLMIQNPDLQVILLTGKATLQKGIEAVKLGAVEFLEKPADIDLLLEKIFEAQSERHILSEKRAEQTVSEIMKHRGW